MSQYIIYARKSSVAEDRQALSIDSQIAELSLYAAKQQILINKIYTESQSARTPGRPVFSEMLKQIESGKSCGILCWNLDRLTRNFQDAASLSHLLQEGYISEIRTPSRVYGSSSTDLFLSGLDFLIAKKYSDDLSENVKRGLQTKLKMGWRPGSAPTGYINEWRKPKGYKTIKPDPKTWKKVRTLWELYLAHSYSVSKLSKISHEIGVPLKRSTIHAMLTNPFYYGHFLWKGELYEGKHKPMITFREYHLVQRLLHKRLKSKIRKSIFSFRGNMTCGQCGSFITAERKYKTLKQSRRISQYTYYHCTRSKDKSCKQSVITEEAIESQIEGALKKITLSKRQLPSVQKYIDRQVSDSKRQNEEITKQLNTELSACDKKLSRLLEFKLSPNNDADDLLSDNEYIEKKNTLLKEKAQIQFKLTNLGSKQNELSTKTKELADFAVNGLKRFITGNQITKRQIFDYLCSNQQVLNKKLIFTIQEPLQEFLASNKPS